MIRAIGQSGFYKTRLCFVGSFFTFLVFLMTLYFSGVTHAAFDDVVLDNTVVEISGLDLLLNGEIDSIIVRDDDFDVVLLPGSFLTVVSDDRKGFVVSVSGESTYTSACGAGDSSLTFVSPGVMSTSTISISGNCDGLSEPGQVSGLAGSVSSSQVALSWTIPSDGGSAITDYLIEYKIGSADAYTLFVDGVQTLNSATVTGLQSSTLYNFRISAVNAVGTGPASTVLSLTTTAAISGGSGGGGSSGGRENDDEIEGSTGSGTITTLTNEEMAAFEAQIKQLLAIIAGLTAQLASQQSGAVTAVNDGYTFSRSLRLWDTGEDVRQLQILLNSDVRTRLSVAPGSEGSLGFETNLFGLATMQAVSLFQELYRSEVLTPEGLSMPTGYVGPRTISKLNSLNSSSGTNFVNILPPTVSPPTYISTPTPSPSQTYISPIVSNLYPGMEGPEVANLQRFLVYKKYLVIDPADYGSYGPATKAAVKDFQCNNNLLCAADSGSVGPYTIKRINDMIADL
jgi:peptidoglycan hydrolase-like protein with peptidoglycan-binding domain